MFFNLLILMFEKNIVSEQLFLRVKEFIFYVKKNSKYIEEDE